MRMAAATILICGIIFVQFAHAECTPDAVTSIGALQVELKTFTDNAQTQMYGWFKPMGMCVSGCAKGANQICEQRKSGIQNTISEAEVLSAKLQSYANSQIGTECEAPADAAKRSVHTNEINLKTLLSYCNGGERAPVH